MTEQQAISRDELITAIKNGATLITGNSRLASAILGEYEHNMRLQDMVAWRTPDVLSVKAWLYRTWEEVVLAGVPVSPLQLLTPDQESHLWESIISHHPQSLLRTQATAKGAQRAWRLMQDWRLQRQESDFSLNEDTRAFSEWAVRYEHLCGENHWLTENGIPAQLIKLISNKTWLPENELMLTGFDELTPALAYLTERLSDAGVILRYVTISESAGKSVRFVAPDTRSEIEAACRWARGRLEKKPAGRIGIVVPDLAAVRTILTDTLTRVLAPDQMLPDSDNISLPWNISLGQPLGSYAVIRLAVHILGLAGNESATEDVGSILRSPYLAGAADEAAIRSRLEGKLLKQGDPFISLSTLHYQAMLTIRPVSTSGDIQPEDDDLTPELLRRFSGLKALQKTCPAKARANEWAVWFGKWLSVAGWASGRTLSSHEYQIAEAWKKLLIDFGTLDAIAGQFSFVAALARIKNMASVRIFQPQTPDTPVQVLGLYEAIGLRFDHLWVMGLHDNVWPPSPRPDPFIPRALQLRHNMPHTSQERELRVARVITERLSRSAAEVVFSYPAQNAEESLRPAPLITDFPDTYVQELELWQGSSWRDLVRASALLEQVCADAVPALSHQQASGGSAIFKYQSLCPFRAFAELRLGARPMANTHSGMDAMQRGQLLHRVLELLWQQVVDQKTLLAIPQEKLDEIVREKIEMAVETYKNRFSSLRRSQFRAVEVDRLLDITLQWLALEKNRSSFTVRSFEKKTSTVVNGVGVNLWIDRIDELDDGRKIIIDYKTGKVSPGDWFGERPNDPQLPLYSVVEGGDIAAVLFGQIRAGELAYKGVVQQADMIPDLPPAKGNKSLKEAMQNWPVVLDEWKQEIERLAKGFSQGDASVNPKNGRATCASSYCQLAVLCRINEMQFISDVDPDDGYE
ncbi:MAG TPA: hypothetical protein ENI64_04945 [Gammaproteobacteria bacterium]|nr:hypothetical protein [Gammaproteobacteria bacterium]